MIMGYANGRLNDLHCGFVDCQIFGSYAPSALSMRRPRSSYLSPSLRVWRAFYIKIRHSVVQRAILANVAQPILHSIGATCAVLVPLLVISMVSLKTYFFILSNQLAFRDTLLHVSIQCRSIAFYFRFKLNNAIVNHSVSHQCRLPLQAAFDRTFLNQYCSVL